MGYLVNERKTRKKERTHTIINVETQNGKNHGSSQTAEYTMREEHTNGKHRGNDLLHPFLATRWLQWRQRPLSLSLSLYTVTRTLYN